MTSIAPLADVAMSRITRTDEAIVAVCGLFCSGEELVPNARVEVDVDPEMVVGFTEIPGVLLVTLGLAV